MMTPADTSPATISQCTNPPHLSHAVTTDDPPYDIEFRSKVDDAWYSARIVLLDNDTTLAVKLQDFPDVDDETFSIADFKTSDDVDEVVKRFRPMSEQLQDYECNKIKDGTRVCASFRFAVNDIRYFDAVVDTVIHKKHLYGKEEECKCKFLLHWLHGPSKGLITCTGIENLCLVEPSQEIDKRVASFSKMAKKKLEPSAGKVSLLDNQLGIQVKQADKQSAIFQEEDAESLSRPDDYQDIDFNVAGTSYIRHEKDLQDIEGLFSTREELSSSSVGETCRGGLQAKEVDTRQFLNQAGRTGGSSCSAAYESRYSIFVDNLEKDVSSSSVVKFIQNHTSICSQAWILPSLSYEAYTRGVIKTDCEDKLKQICKFLNSPDHIVTSSKGRPWVIREEPSMCKAFQTTTQGVTSLLQEKTTGVELKVVDKESQEYRAAKRKRELFMNFVEHEKGVHKKLALEEKKISSLQMIHSGSDRTT